MNHYTIQSSYEVNQEQIDDVVTTALEGGITYWCGQATTNVDLGDNYLSEMLTRGATIMLLDSEEYNPVTKEYGVWRELTLEKLLKAFGETKFDFDNYDAGDADAVVQKAVFGEVVYG